MHKEPVIQSSHMCMMHCGAREPAYWMCKAYVVQSHVQSTHDIKHVTAVHVEAIKPSHNAAEEQDCLCIIRCYT